MTPYGRGEAWEDNPEGWPVIGDVGEGHPSEGRQACWYWRSDADGVATWSPTSRPVPLDPGPTMTGGQCALLAQLLPAAGSTDGRGGRPEKWDRRLVLEAISQFTDALSECGRGPCREAESPY
jgi:hypothetical protein